MIFRFSETAMTSEIAFRAATEIGYYSTLVTFEAGKVGAAQSRQTAACGIC